MGKVFDMESKRSRKEPRPRREYTDEFKAGAVALVLTEGRRISDVARDLDLTQSALSGWVKQAKVESGKGPAGALTKAERDELTRLRKRTASLDGVRHPKKRGGASSRRARSQVDRREKAGP
jgi:transposase